MYHNFLLIFYILFIYFYYYKTGYIDLKKKNLENPEEYKEMKTTHTRIT